MYNRYIPQPDGSYHRNRVSDRTPPPPAPVPPPEPSIPLPEKKKPQGNMNITSFFKNLLPKDLDTGDLIILLLLLLLANDCEQDRNHALLTLALYFFL